MANLKFSYRKVLVALLGMGVLFLSASITKAGGLPYVAPPACAADLLAVAEAIPLP
jgi:hypothetical protein